MRQADLRTYLETIPLYHRLVFEVLPALSGGVVEPGAYELVLVGRSDVRQASVEVAVLACASSLEVAVVWLPNTLFRRESAEESSAEVTVHVYPKHDVTISAAAVVHESGTKEQLILVLPDGQAAGGYREVRVAITGEPGEVGAAVHALRTLGSPKAAAHRVA